MSNKYTKSQLKSLNEDAEFKQFVREDKELERLFNAPQLERKVRFSELLLSRGGSVYLEDGKVILQPITLGILTILGVLESPFLLHNRDVTQRDIAIAVYVFIFGQDVLDDVDCIEDVETVGEAVTSTMLTDYQSAYNAIVDMINLSFEAVKRIPEGGKTGKNCVFDLGWMVDTASRVSSAAGCSAEHAAWTMPLNLAIHYMISWQGQQGQRLIMPTAIEKTMDYLHKMMDKRIKERGYE